MQIELTVPIIVNDFLICEFDGAFDINVISYGYAAQTMGLPENCYPEEGPEWEVEGTYIAVAEKDGRGRLVDKMVECPDELLIFMTRYSEGEEFADNVCAAIAQVDSW